MASYNLIFGVGLCVFFVFLQSGNCGAIAEAAADTRYYGEKIMCYTCISKNGNDTNCERPSESTTRNECDRDGYTCVTLKKDDQLTRRCELRRQQNLAVEGVCEYLDKYFDECKACETNLCNSATTITFAFSLFSVIIFNFIK